MAGNGKARSNGRIVTLPGGERAKVLDIEHEYDDGTTLRYVTGLHAGSLTMRDTSAVRRYQLKGDPRRGH